MTRSTGEKKTWFKTLGRMFSPEPSATPITNLSPTEADAYPMIQVANPNVAEGQPPTILVYRTWTIEDAKKAVEGVTSHKGDVNQFVQDMESIRQSYHLNEQEVQQIWMAALGSDWHYVRGTWNPVEGGPALAHNDQELNNLYEV